MHVLNERMMYMHSFCMVLNLFEPNVLLHTTTATTTTTLILSFENGCYQYLWLYTVTFHHFDKRLRIYIHSFILLTRIPEFLELHRYPSPHHSRTHNSATSSGKGLSNRNGTHVYTWYMNMYISYVYTNAFYTRTCMHTRTYTYTYIHTFTHAYMHT